MSTPTIRKVQKSGLTNTFVRKPFEIEAVQVTEENMHDVAKWCGGKIKTRPGQTEESSNEKYILVPVHNPTNEEQKMASVGKWVLWSRTTAFKVYSKRAFASSFDPKVTKPEPLTYTQEDSEDQLKDYAKPEDSPLHPEHQEFTETPNPTTGVQPASELKQLTPEEEEEAALS